MKRCLGLLPLLFLFACASLHTPSPHFTPTITKKNQFEGQTSFGYKMAGVSFAYSPLNKLTVMGNVQALPLFNYTKSFQRNVEVALGTYGSAKKIMYGVNAGYGMGSYNWDYNQRNDSMNYILSTNGRFQKLMVQAFFALTDDSSNPQWCAGISLKGNFYWDQYVSLKKTSQLNQDFKGMEQNSSFEPCFFVRDFFSQRFYIDLQAGMNIAYDHSMFWPTQYLYSRIGIGIKF
jgi:hypothetical protein